AAGLFEVQTGASIWYPPAGLRFAFLLLFGWPFGLVVVAAEAVRGVVAVALFGEVHPWLIQGDGARLLPPAVGFTIAVAIGPAAYTFVAWMIGPKVRLGGGPDPFAGILWLCGGGAAAALLNAGLATAHHAANGFFAWSQFHTVAAAFWMGDMVGILTLTPALVLLGRAAARRHGSGWIAPTRAADPPPPPLPLASPGRLTLEAAVIAVAVAAAFAAPATIADMRDAFRWYPLVLPIMWLSLRFGLSGAAWGVLVVNIIVAALLATMIGLDGIFDVQMFMILLSAAGLLMGSAASTLAAERVSLDHRVKERTAALRQEVAARAAAERATIAAKERAETYLAMARTAIIAVDVQGRVTLANDAVCALLGRTPDAVRGHAWADVAAPRDGQSVWCEHLSRMATNCGEADARFQADVLDNEGNVLHLDWWATRVCDGSGTVKEVLLAGVDITERIDTERRIRYLATHDPLTGLSNRTALLDRFESAIARARRSDTGVGLLFLDLTGFKGINDIHGHADGDRLLTEIAGRLRGCVRESDTVARFGGDEFVVLLEDLIDHGAARAIAEKTLKAVVQPIELSGGWITPQVSIGVAVFPDHGPNLDALLLQADRAMYRVKRRGGHGYQFGVSGPEDDAGDQEFGASVA
ncbi:MAG: diguanylate cyclase, partial [Rhodospirillales bacterium]